MTGSELYKFIYDWANSILNEPTETIPVIQAFQNAPAPAENYIAIPKAPNTNLIGTNARRAYNDSEEVQSFINEYEGVITLREVGGTGDNLRQLINTLDLLSVKKLFADNQISLLRWGNVVPAPRLDEESWKEEYLLELTFLLIDQVDDSRTWIETVDIEPNYTKIGET